MADNFNTTAGWALFSGIVALGLSSVSGHYFGANKEHRPEKMGYAIAGVPVEGGPAEVPIEALLATADPVKGEAVFKKCASCHTIASGGANGIGPNLFGVLGEGVATGRGGFAFSDGLKAKGGKWDFATMNAWLTNPKAFVAGTKMTFPGLELATDRANLLTYINKQGSNLPLPAAPPPGAAPVADAAKVAVGDPVKGEAVFKKCASCHTITPGGANGIGPNLNHIIGDDIGKSRGGFAFSEALATKGGKWDDASIDAWLTNPRGFAAGTKMTFAGLENAQDRADVVAFMKK